MPHPERETWHGWTELRKMELNELEIIIEFYRQKLTEMNLWEFAASYVPMTQAQKEECERRAAEEANG